jgi:hypothetical protein
MAKSHKPSLTQERLKELLHYDPETGLWTWKVQRNWRKPVGSIAGAISKASFSNGGGYRYIGLDGRDYLAHRLAVFYMTGEWQVGELDHRDTNRDNNRWTNLRPATHDGNGANAKLRSHNKTGFKGVSFNKHAGRYMVNVGKYYIGLFDTAEEAHQAYCDAAHAKYGEFFRPK